MKGFYAKAVVRNNGVRVGERCYMKAVGFHHGSPTLFAILDQKTGVKKLEIDGNEFKNWFVRVA